ncbi:MAG: hypothetical protein V1776_02455 [Candidatus Diapherotrites archaeon]
MNIKKYYPLIIVVLAIAVIVLLLQQTSPPSLFRDCSKEDSLVSTLFYSPLKVTVIACLSEKFGYDTMTKGTLSLENQSTPFEYSMDVARFEQDFKVTIPSARTENAPLYSEIKKQWCTAIERAREDYPDSQSLIDKCNEGAFEKWDHDTAEIAFHTIIANGVPQIYAGSNPASFQQV